MKIMKEKCTKFQSLYLFRSEEELEEHLKVCPDCRAEKEKMDKVSDLLQEVKPYYDQQRRKSSLRLKIACILCFGMLSCLAITYFMQLANQNIPSDSYYYSTETTQTSQATNEYGIPVDSYGLITVN